MLKSLFGWEGDAEVALYTKARDRRRLAESGSALWTPPEQIEAQISAQPEQCGDLKKKTQ